MSECKHIHIYTDYEKNSVFCCDCGIDIVTDLCAKLEAAEKLNIDLLDDYYAKDREDTRYLNQAVKFQQERDDLRRQLEEEKVICYQYKSNGEMWFKTAKDFESQNAALRGALEDVKQLFPQIFEYCSLDDCLNTDCTMANEADMMCRKIAKIVSQALTASGENRYLKIREAIKETIEAFKSYGWRMPKEQQKAILNLADALGE